MGGQLHLAVELGLANGAFEFLLVQMSVHMITHVACRREAFGAIRAAKGFLASMRLEMVLQACGVAHDSSAVPVGTLESLYVLCQLIFLAFLVFLDFMLFGFFSITRVIWVCLGRRIIIEATRYLALVETDGDEASRGRIFYLYTPRMVMLSHHPLR